MTTDRFGVVTLAALDARPRPDHRSELVSQLLLGETVRVLAADDAGHWLRVRNERDGYAGWVRGWGIRPLDAMAAARWGRRAMARIADAYAPVTAEPGRGHVLTPAFWNGRLVAGRARGRHRQVELPDGRRGWIRATALARAGRPPGIVARIRLLLGTPYLWGGRTPLGFDCSGFVQQLLWEQGVSLPRDAQQQHDATRCSALDARSLRLGDLVYFGTSRKAVGHVALALGRGYYAHCRGCVRINSLFPDNQMYDNELFDQVVGYGRPAQEAKRTPGRPSGA
jgi:hypothetical protein